MCFEEVWVTSLLKAFVGPTQVPAILHLFTHAYIREQIQQPMTMSRATTVSTEQLLCTLWENWIHVSTQSQLCASKILSPRDTEPNFIWNSTEWSPHASHMCTHMHISRSVSTAWASLWVHEGWTGETYDCINYFQTGTIRQFLSRGERFTLCPWNKQACVSDQTFYVLVADNVQPLQCGSQV